MLVQLIHVRSQKSCGDNEEQVHTVMSSDY